MFIFGKQKQKTKRDIIDNKLLRVLPKLHRTDSLRQILLSDFYQKTYEKIGEGSWPQLSILYRQEIAYIRKNQTVWNYKDMSILQKNLKRSMQSGTLSAFIVKWTADFKIFVLNRLNQFGNVLSNENKTEMEKKYFVSQQIRLFVQFLYHVFFEIYNNFFISHSASKNSINTKGLQKKVFQQYSEYFQYLIRNMLTGAQAFNSLYLDIEQLFIWNKPYPFQREGEFEDFLLHKLLITDPPEKVYLQTFSILIQFAKEPDISKKLQLAFQIQQKVEADHRRYFEKTKTIAKRQEQPIKRPLFWYLFQRASNNLKASVEYINILLYKPNKVEFKKLQLEYNLKKTQNIHQQQSNFKVLLEQFCLLFIHEGAECEISIVLDVLNELQY